MNTRRNPFSRRNFVGGLGASALATPAALASQRAMAMEQSGGADDDMTVEEMDEMHRQSTQAFPAETAGKGNQPLEYEMDGDVKVFRLETSVFDWEFRPGEYAEAWGYNGAVPGPEIRVTEGDKVRFIVTNTNLPESTSVHWHGLILPYNMDGVPYLSQPPIKPGETFVYEWTIREGNAGSHMYHSHHNSAFQVTHGLLGAFIIEPKDRSKLPEYDKEYTLILNDGPIGQFTINGKSFPAGEPIVAKQGEKVLLRFMNEGLMIHPMHLHGMPMTVIATDGQTFPQPWMCDTLNIAPGQRWDAIVHATEPGIWAFHCHILSHAESKHGMFGMVTAFIVE
jgi:FtsP/CotA-like multicopper oxidase with cupredoxin domain